MPWGILFIVITLLGAAGTIVNVNRVRFAALLERERGHLHAVEASPIGYREQSDLPAPVARYRSLAVGARRPVRTLELHHGGDFFLKPDARASAIVGTQHFTADPPGFFWSARIRMAPGVWLDARDECINGIGSLKVLLDDTVEVANARGALVDQGEALRLLAELPWYPTAMFDARTVTWGAIDEHHARATLHLPALDVSAVFEFSDAGLPSSVKAQRYSDDGTLAPWGGVYSAFRRVSGMLVPFEVEVSWQRPTGPWRYAHWFVDSVAYDGEPVASE